MSHAQALPQPDHRCYTGGMNELPEAEKSRADRPLMRSLLRTEILITLPTLVISIALAYFSFVQADASRKMQRTETWPYVSYETGNSSNDGKAELSFTLSNDGVGPARVEEMELVYDGKPMRGPLQFLSHCCRSALMAMTPPLSFATDQVEGVLRAGQERRFFVLTKTDKNAALWDRLNEERWKVVVRTCYCSIFDDCWVSDSHKAQPQELKTCPADWTKFEPMTDAPPRPAKT